MKIIIGEIDPNELDPGDVEFNIRYALDLGFCLDIVYDGKPKTVEVHAYGLSSKDNEPVMRVFQVAGESSRPLPSWAMLKVLSITSLNLSDTISAAPRPGYKMGDSHMSKIFQEVKL